MAQEDTRVIPHFLQKIKNEEKIPVHGKGTQKRTYFGAHSKRR